MFGSLKSGGSRTVALPPVVVHALAPPADGKDRNELLGRRAQAVSRVAGTYKSWLSGAMQGARKPTRRSPGGTAHDLWHTAASPAISAGANPKVVQRMLGHTSTAMMLDVYADSFESDLDDVADQFEKVLTACSRSAQ